ncbi:uncharacterized protein [Procambarus clarkii]|uniref:uncharacterized protein n=1 Tax=Procambarus clarkii TaxID=6728 RepID=UPI003741F2A8
MELWRMRQILPMVFLVMLETQGGRCDLELHPASSPASGINNHLNTKNDAHIEYNQIREFVQLIPGFVDGMLCSVKKQLNPVNGIQREHHLAMNNEEYAAQRKIALANAENCSECYQICIILYDTVATAKIALSSFEDYKDNFALDTFNKTWEEVLAEIGDTDFGIPPSIPPVPDNVDLKEEMARVFGQLQCHLVGLEDVILDQSTFSKIDPVLKTNDLDTEVDFYLEKFTSTIDYIEELLGYTRMGMKELDVVPDEALTQELTNRGHQVLDTVEKGVRDFIILKKYEEGLQYVMAAFTQVFKELCTNASCALNTSS